MMAENCYGREQVGAAKEGSALLAGILRCRRCGRKLMVRYTGNRHDVLRYACYRAWLDNGEPPVYRIRWITCGLGDRYGDCACGTARRDRSCGPDCRRAESAG